MAQRLATPPPPHVRVAANHLEIDGRPTFLLGGEVQYFRVRDAGFDAAATHRLWSARLDQLRAAGANYITTCVPWDYHAPGPGAYDWGGARDLVRFLETAAERGFRLALKPGPHIIAEFDRLLEGRSRGDPAAQAFDRFGSKASVRTRSSGPPIVRPVASRRSARRVAAS